MILSPCHPSDLTARLVVEGYLPPGGHLSALNCTTLPPHEDCRRPEFCKGGSMLALCEECGGEVSA